MLSFDLIYSNETSGFSSFVLAAEKKEIAPLGLLTTSDAPFAGELSIPSIGVKEQVLCFFRFPYEERVWDLTKSDELSLLLSKVESADEDFLSIYRSTVTAAIKSTDCRFAFGLEAFASALGEDRFSPAYRKALLDLTDRLIKRNLILGYAVGNEHFDLSPCVLRRFAELRGDLLPASFAKRPSEVGKSFESTLLSARAAGIGSYMTYGNAGWERRPITTFKENP